MKTKLVAPPIDMLEKLWVMALLTVVSAGLYPLVYYARLHSRLARLVGQAPFNWKLLLALVICGGLATSVVSVVSSFALAPYSSQQDMVDRIYLIYVLNIVMSLIQISSFVFYIFIAIQTRKVLIAYSERFHARFDVVQPSLVWCLVFNLFYINHYLVNVRKQTARVKLEQKSLKSFA